MEKFQNSYFSRAVAASTGLEIMGAATPPVGKALKNLRQGGGGGGGELKYKGHEGAPKKGFFTRFMVTLGSKIYKNTMINNG